MSMIDIVKAKARSDVKSIVLPEGDEVRTVEAASILMKEGLARKPVSMVSSESPARRGINGFTKRKGEEPC